MEQQPTNERSSSPDVPEFYADSLRLTLGPFSVGFEFGINPFSSDNVTRDAIPVARVRVSPHLAQAAKELLTQNMELYEALFGEIKVPAGYIETPRQRE